MHTNGFPRARSQCAHQSLHALIAYSSEVEGEAFDDRVIHDLLGDSLDLVG